MGGTNAAARRRRANAASPDPRSPIPNPQPLLPEKIAVVPVPSQLPRFVVLPSETELCLARLEDVIAAGVGQLFPGCDVLATAVFRITRDADVTIQDDDASDLLHVVEEAVLGRRRRGAVRLEISAASDPRIRKWLQSSHRLDEDDIYEIDGMLDAAALWSIANRPGFDALKVAGVAAAVAAGPAGRRGYLADAPGARRAPLPSLRELRSGGPVAPAGRRRPRRLAIKQTLYRTSGDSPIVQALERAAENGKEVTALVELKARFDEARNVTWARRLEDAGAHVIYGIVGYKTHAKALLIVRREATRVRRYVHLSTGNYNDRTARLYSDVGLMTSDRDLAADVAAFFNLLTGYSESIGWSKLTCEPRRLKERFIDLVDREAQVSTPDRPGLIQAKLNSLQDREIIRALYKAAQAGVKIMLNVRGICCLRPGVPGVSENIEVRSIVDRYLEHARIFFFRNGGHEEVYLSSADWMHRNLDRRIEMIFPVTAPNLRRRLIEILETGFGRQRQSPATPPRRHLRKSPRRPPGHPGPGALLPRGRRSRPRRRASHAAISTASAAEGVMGWRVTGDGWVRLAPALVPGGCEGVAGRGGEEVSRRE